MLGVKTQTFGPNVAVVASGQRFAAADGAAGAAEAAVAVALVAARPAMASVAARISGLAFLPTLPTGRMRASRSLAARMRLISRRNLTPAKSRVKCLEGVQTVNVGASLVASRVLQEPFVQG
jgi:hypothetical protein